ncbi:MAG: diaminopimelate epimerase [Acidimicrobiales bacterium mtb01]|nr:diaminopimelate epimerase [Actinomycetota bacterium]TEX44901.1 MAG: diaminopimelate epimerase [Acidimicrobiales bacterium mtb01]
MSTAHHVVLTKHHGLGNDFLVYDTAQDVRASDWAELARRWCDRRTGVGADGLLLLDRQSTRHVGMTLHNADGSRAEMSGNGIRCLVQAAHLADSTIPGDAGNRSIEYIVDTDAGRRTVSLVGQVDPHTVMASVDMGEVSDLPEPPGWSSLECHPDRPVRHVSLGNPHSVVGVDDVRAVDLGRLGSLVPQINLEIIEPGPEQNGITMRVHERGAGITMACGTGACAAAEAARAWGLVPASSDEVIVHMDGGDARVRVDGRRVVLIGPSTYVGSVTVPL